MKTRPAWPVKRTLARHKTPQTFSILSSEIHHSFKSLFGAHPVHREKPNRQQVVWSCAQRSLRMTLYSRLRPFKNVWYVVSTTQHSAEWQRFGIEQVSKPVLWEYPHQLAAEGCASRIQTSSQNLPQFVSDDLPRIVLWSERLQASAPVTNSSRIPQSYQTYTTSPPTSRPVFWSLSLNASRTNTSSDPHRGSSNDLYLRRSLSAVKPRRENNTNFAETLLPGGETHAACICTPPPHTVNNQQCSGCSPERTKVDKKTHHHANGLHTGEDPHLA